MGWSLGKPGRWTGGGGHTILKDYGLEKNEFGKKGQKQLGRGGKGQKKSFFDCKHTRDCDPQSILGPRRMSLGTKKEDHEQRSKKKSFSDEGYC